MHDGEGFGDVWADDDDGGWDGGADFAGFDAGEAVFYGEGGGERPDDLEPGDLPVPLPGTGGLTPLAAGLLQLPSRRPRRKVRPLTPPVLTHACLQLAGSSMAGNALA